MNKFQIISKDPAETIRLAEWLSTQVKLGDIVLMDGTLGTGKTWFVKGFAKAMGYQENVTSPTFNIANFYELENGNILHIDAYRMESIAEFRDLGLSDYYDESIVLIEWGSKIAEDFDDYLQIEFEFHGEGNVERKITFSTIGNSFSLEKMEASLSVFSKEKISNK